MTTLISRNFCIKFVRVNIWNFNTVLRNGKKAPLSIIHNRLLQSLCIMRERNPFKRVKWCQTAPFSFLQIILHYVRYTLKIYPSWKSCICKNYSFIFRAAPGRLPLTEVPLLFCYWPKCGWKELAPKIVVLVGCCELLTNFQMSEMDVRLWIVDLFQDIKTSPFDYTTSKVCTVHCFDPNCGSEIAMKKYVYYRLKLKHVPFSFAHSTKNFCLHYLSQRKWIIAIQRNQNVLKWWFEY